MSFGFGGNDPDEVGNLSRQLEETRLFAQNMQAEMQVMRTENAELKRQVAELTGPTDYTLLVVKNV